MNYTKLQSRNSKFRLELINRITPTEKIVKDWLEENKIRFMFQKGFLKPFSRIVDF